MMHTSSKSLPIICTALGSREGGAALPCMCFDVKSYGLQKWLQEIFWVFWRWTHLGLLMNGRLSAVRWKQNTSVRHTSMKWKIIFRKKYYQWRWKVADVLFFFVKRPFMLWYYTFFQGYAKRTWVIQRSAKYCAIKKSTHPCSNGCWTEVLRYMLASHGPSFIKP